MNMIIAITSTGKDLKSKTDQRFGRSKFIIFYDINNSNFEYQSNNLNLNTLQGAGIQTAQNIADKGVNAVITGNLGPKAFTVLKAANINVFQSSSVTIEETIQLYKNNKLQTLNNPNVQGHWS